jgi:hypothetical protein
MPLQTENLRTRIFTVVSSKPFMFVICLLAAGTVILFHYKHQREKIRAIESVHGKFFERVNALDRAVSLIATNVNLKKNWVTGYWTVIGKENDSFPV